MLINPYRFGPVDPYFSSVSLLLHGDGTNGSTTIIDSSSSPKTVTAFGNAQISTAQSKFGSSSIYFDGSGDYLLIPNSAAFGFGTGDFTVELWINPNASGSQVYARLLQCGDYPNGWQLVRGPIGGGTSNPISVWVDFLGGSALRLGGGTIQNNQWSHVAMTRANGTVRIFVNGVIAASGTSSSDLGQHSVIIGSSSSGSEAINAYMNEIRITKGVARYTANFTPPTAPFPNQ